MKKGKGDSREEIRNICREIGVNIEIEEFRNIRTGRKEKGEMVIVKVKTEGNRRQILVNKKK